MNCHSYNAHLGDLIWCLTAMSRLPGEHVLCCNPDYVEALTELVQGLPITIEDCSNVRPNSFDAWIASGMFAHKGIHYRDDIDIMGFVQKYWNTVGEEAGMGTSFPKREDMLCKFPVIEHLSYDQRSAFRGILVINCDPKSGQCPRYSSSEMDTLIHKLQDAGHSVCAVEKAELSLAMIGAISIHAKLIIGCATGPLWSCLNTWTRDTPKIVMLDPMRLDYGNSSITHAADANELEELLKWMKIL